MICTSDLCKNISIIVAIFFALYLIVTNSSNNAKELFTEQNANTVVEKAIKDIWKSVYFVDIPDQSLQNYIENKIFVDKFDPNDFKNTLVLERVYALEKTVEDVFLKVLKRHPTPEEKKMYVKALYSYQIKDTNELERIVSNSPENATTSDATRSEAKQRILRKEDYALYKQIIDEYKNTLDRLPSTAELNFYFDKMKKDSSFNLAKLNKALTSSREHLMLEMNQRNIVHGELEGNVTERQLELVINGVYEEIYGHEPDEVTYKFLRTKFLDMHLNEEAFLNFIKQLKRLEDRNNKTISKEFNEMSQSTYSYSPLLQSSKISVVDKVLKTAPDTTYHYFDKPELTDLTDDLYTQKPLLNVGTTDIIDEIKTAFDSKERASFTVYKKNTEEYITDSDIVNAHRKNETVQCPIKNTKEETKLTNEYDKRNEDLIRFRESQSRYVNADKDLVLNPEFKWSVPQTRPPVCYGRQDEYNPQMTQTALIGTLLEDAKDTQVGSIMPKFKFTTR
jgi:hypothetical protein